MIITIENTVEGEELLNIKEKIFLNLYKTEDALIYLVFENGLSKKIYFTFDEMEDRDIAYEKIKEQLVKSDDFI